MEKMPLLLILLMLPLFSRVDCQNFQKVTSTTLIDMQYVFQNVLVKKIVDAHTKDDLQLSVDIQACIDKIKVTQEKCQSCRSEKCNAAPPTNPEIITDTNRDGNNKEPPQGLNPLDPTTSLTRIINVFQDPSWENFGKLLVNPVNIGLAIGDALAGVSQKAWNALEDTTQKIGKETERFFSKVEAETKRALDRAGKEGQRALDRAEKEGQRVIDSVRNEISRWSRRWGKRRKRSTDPQRKSNGDVTDERLESFEIEKENLSSGTQACYDKCTMCYDVLSKETDILVRTVCGADILIRNRTLENQKRNAQSFYKVLENRTILTNFEYDVDSFKMVNNTSPQFLSTRVTAEMPTDVASTYVSKVPYITTDHDRTANLLAKEALQRWNILTEDTNDSLP